MRMSTQTERHSIHEYVEDPLSFVVSLACPQVNRINCYFVIYYFSLIVYSAEVFSSERYLQRGVVKRRTPA